MRYRGVLMLVVVVVCLVKIDKWSGRRDSDPRPSAWEADALPLSYSRISAVMAFGTEVVG